MKNRTTHFVAIAFLLLSCQAFADKEPLRLSESARFTLLTCSPGPDLYSLFGHTAIRLEDYGEGNNTDIVFNYGTFDFDTENFYLKFARGQLPYELTVSTFGDFQIEYIYSGRGIWEQELLLTQAEKQKLFDLLAENALPENCQYRYDFFYDNCSTRIRDIIANAVDNKVQFTYAYPRKYTFRQAIQSYLDYQPWSDFGIDLALGMPCDREMEYAQCMFLPDSLMHEFNYAMHNDLHLVKPVEEVLPQEFELSSTSFFTPIMVFVLFLIAHTVIGWWLIKKKGIALHATDRILFFVVGLIGLMVVLLWFFTDHNATKWNLNILWANPLLLFFACLPTSKWTGWKKKFISVYFFLVMAVLFSWFFLPQRLHLAVLPICAALAFTCLKMLRPHIFTPQKTQPPARG